MATCIQVFNPDGTPSGLFTSLLAKFNGNEQKALEAYAEAEIKASKNEYQLASNIGDGKGFINAFFPIIDEFTQDTEANFRNNADMYFVETVDKNTKEKIITYHTPTGQIIQRPASEKSTAIDEMVSQLKDLKNTVDSKLKTVYESHKSGGLENASIDAFGENAYPIVTQSISGLVPSEIKNYRDFASEPWYIPSLASEKIMVHVKTDSNGKKIYDLIFPSFSRGGEGFNSSQKNFVGKKFLGSNDLSESHGITVTGSIEGRKQIAGAMLAASIKHHEPESAVQSARFLSFLGQGEFKHLDINHGLESLSNMMKVPNLSSSIPQEMEFMNANPEVFSKAGNNLDYVALLFDEYNAVHDNNAAIKEFSEAYEARDKKRMLDAVNKRMYYIIKHYGKIIGYKKEYEIAETKIGKEYLMLSRSKKQLMMKEGFDYRGVNTDHEMHWIESWIHTQGEYANVDLNLVFQETQAITEGIKQRFLNKHVKKMMAAVDKFIKANNGRNAKGMLINDTQAYYQNLFESIELRVLQPDGQLSDTKQKANILMFKDPEDLTNNLTTAEREFIKSMIELHKESLVKMVDKKIKDGLISGFDSGNDWYNKKFKHNERLIPITRKDSTELLGSGQIKESWNAFIDDFVNIYNLNDQGQTNKDFIFSKYGSASNLIGGNYGSTQRLKSLGIESMNGELVIVDPAKNESASLNVERSLNLAAFNNEKASMEMELHTVYEASKINLLNDKLANRGKELETLKAMFENIVYGDVEKTKFLKNKDTMKTVGALRKITSSGTLALNWKSGLLATMGANITLISDAMSQRYGEAFFSFKDYTKAVAWASSHPSKFDKLIDLFMFHESDEINLLFSDKYQASQKGIYKSRYNMILHAGGDRLVRGIMLTSQLIHDGIIDNFIEQDGELVYDWSKDKRPKEIQDTIKANLEERGVENLPYDEVMMRSLTTISGKILGSFTDADKARFQASESAKVFMQFKAYLGARATGLYSQGFENTNIRSYKVDENGNLTIHTYYQEGIYQSVKHLYLEVKRLKSINGVYSSMRPEQQANIKKLIFDLSMFGGSAILYAMIKSVLDDDFEKSDEYRYLTYAWYDIVGIYNISDFLSALGTPVVVMYMERVLKAAYNIAILDFEKGGERALNLFAPARTFSDLGKVFDN